MTNIQSKEKVTQLQVEFHSKVRLLYQQRIKILIVELNILSLELDKMHSKELELIKLLPKKEHKMDGQLISMYLVVDMVLLMSIGMEIIQTLEKSTNVLSRVQVNILTSIEIMIKFIIMVESLVSISLNSLICRRR